MSAAGRKSGPKEGPTRGDRPSRDHKPSRDLKPSRDDSGDQELESLLEYLQARRGFDFTGYKRSNLSRRIRKRMDEVGIDGFGDYMDYLEVHPDEFQKLFNSILINVTDFFRDPEAWKVLNDKVIGEIAKSSGAIRVWVAGCATGQEAYTVAILLLEHLGEKDFRDRVKLYASDLDGDALTSARTATYTGSQTENLPAEWIEKYFVSTPGHYAFRPDLRRSVIFGQLDLVQDAPISKVDLICCRNTLMYFNAELQSRILARFHFALNHPGFLFLGRAEMLLTHGNLFTPLDLKHRIFRKVPKVNLADRLFLLGQTAPAEAVDQAGAQIELRDIMFEVDPNALIVIDPAGRMTMANRTARLTFDLSRGDVGRPFQDLELSYRPAELRSVIREVSDSSESRVLRDVERHLPDGRVQFLDITVAAVKADDRMVGVAITFVDVTETHRLREELRRSNHELETAYEELQSTNEELETTNEELQSTVEELETTNEELQSSNEELHTMNEELQSSNEELHTINDELRDRTGALAEANSFLEGLIGSLHHGLIIVDRKLVVRAWNESSFDLWGLRPEETDGQPLRALDVGLPVEEVARMAEEIVSKRRERSEKTIEAVNRRGKKIRCRVFAMPFQRDGDIAGAVILTEELPD